MAITALTVGSILFILVFYGAAAWISWKVFKLLGIDLKKIFKP